MVASGTAAADAGDVKAFVRLQARLADALLRADRVGTADRLE
jgi:hypothetical protein